MWLVIGAQKKICTKNWWSFFEVLALRQFQHQGQLPSIGYAFKRTIQKATQILQKFSKSDISIMLFFFLTLSYITADMIASIYTYHEHSSRKWKLCCTTSLVQIARYIDWLLRAGTQSAWALRQVTSLYLLHFLTQNLSTITHAIN